MNSSGLELEVMNYGATILGLNVPNKYGGKTNVIVSLDSPKDYLNPSYKNHDLYMGCSIGRYAGRISKGEFRIHNTTYSIHNTNGIHLHGGKEGFDAKFWNFENINQKNSSVTLSYLSEDGEEGYPGNLKVKVTYKLLESNALKITYEAQTDKSTPVNITNHNYFNLNGAGSILDHEIQISSNQYLEVNSDHIPTGKVINSKQTRYDLLEKASIGSLYFAGFDDTFVLDNKKSKAGSLTCNESGIRMEVFTNQPSVVIFTPIKFPNLNFKNKAVYKEYPAICFETQNYTDAPNNSHFPNAILKPAEIYLNETVFKFTLK